MHVLVTNDDGVHAAGIEVLARCAAEVFGESVIVAPDGERSGSSQALSLHTPLRVERVGEGRYAVEGTPVDSVFIGLGHILAERPPAMVLSGINHGPNIGNDVYYSGTVGAAREALIHGIPAVALSIVGRSPLPFDELEPVVIEVLRRVRGLTIPARTLLNVNIPLPDATRGGSWLGVAGLRGVKLTKLGERYYSNEVVHREDPRGRSYFWVGGSLLRMDHVEGSDCEAVRDGWVSITPIGLDATNYAARDTLASLEA